MQDFSLKKDLNGFVDSLQKGEFVLSTEQQVELATITAEIQGKKDSVRRRIFAMHIIEEADNSSLSPLFESYKARVAATLRKHTTALHQTHQIELPEGVTLRPKQIRFMGKLKDYFDPAKGKRSGFVKYPTGMGKTILISIMIKSLIRHGGSKALVLSPKDIVNEQNENKIKSFQSADVIVEDVQTLNGGPQPDVTIATYNLAALEAGRIGQNSKLGGYDVIFLDECHRAFGPKVLEFFIKRYPKAVLVGLSATPYIGATEDPTKLKSAFQYFEGEIDSISLKEACNDGDLAPIRAYRIDAKFAHSSTVVDGDEVRAKDNSFARTNIALDIARNKIPVGEKTIVFCTGIDHARHTALELQKAGFLAESVDSKMDRKDIDRIIQDYKAGKLQYIVNADMLTEGFDDEETVHAIMLRPTKSAWMYEQMIGRAARLDPKNPQKIATIWDVVGQHSDQCTVHGLAKFYGDHRTAFLNGTVVFGSEELTNLKTPGVAKVRQQNNDLYVIDSDILVENIAKIQVPRDKVYYENPEYLKADLEAFAKASGKSILELNTHNATAETICSNGESVKFVTYIRNAGQALGIAEDAIDAHSKGAEILKKLKKLAGFEQRDESYYNDPKKVKVDLEAFAKVCGKTVLGLSTSDNSCQAICSTGETVKFLTYIKNAGVALGLTEGDKDGQSKIVDTLKTLRKMAGFDVKEFDERDESYYKDPKKVKADLEAFAKACGKTVLGLSTSDNSCQAICSTGETVKFLTYIKNAGVALGLTKGDKDGQSKVLDTLKRLQKMAGFDIKELDERDESYYKDSKKVKADLEAFAKVCGKTVLALSTSDVAAEAICSNGETVKYITYIRNAGVALGLARHVREASTSAASILQLLKEMAL
jgi:superfamily II DNA or RNA helicase